ncbi:MAG: EscU/YscU/HrcU family type III secretion system export apparatus switch protein [Planctomycetes bacterium]|nr:EscU/YscU/HrcU family type III secretion system export apparatus switch protein [Planctomycetota bacterium]
MTGSRPALALSRQVAVALGYDAARDRAPRILASGRGKTAEEIRRIARRHGVMVREDGDLAELLGRVPPFEEIPPRLYPVVAELLVFVYRMSRLASAPKS